MRFLTLHTSILFSGLATAFPPAPYHEIYGMVRDEGGRPLSAAATVRLNGPSGPILSGAIDSGIGLGVNYSLKVPMDAGTQAQLYQTSALLPAMPFTVEVIISGISYVPIEVQGGSLNIGAPGGRTKLDLTLGVDSDGDGLPDSWEQQLSDITGAGGIENITRDGDNDGDGVSNYLEYLAGTYAFSKFASFRLEILEVKDGFAHLRFLAVTGHGYKIKAMIDGGAFNDASFSFAPDGANPQSVFRSERLQFENVYIPVDDVKSKLFRLHVY